MTTTYAAVHIIANGKPYIFSVDATDTTDTAMVNVVSGRTLGETFAGGATVTSVGPVTLNSSDATGSSASILGAVITDPQNNVVAEISWADPERTPLALMTPTNIPVGLNYAMRITTTNS